MSYVNFIKSKTREEALREKKPGAIYFPTDYTSIILNGKEYGMRDGNLTDEQIGLFNFIKSHIKGDSLSYDTDNEILYDNDVAVELDTNEFIFKSDIVNLKKEINNLFKNYYNITDIDKVIDNKLEPINKKIQENKNIIYTLDNTITNDINNINDDLDDIKDDLETITTALSTLLGYNLITKNEYEKALGRYNASTQSDNNAEATAFSIGYGTSESDRKNAIEVKKNGDVHITSLYINGVKFEGTSSGGSSGDSTEKTEDEIFDLWTNLE